MWFYHKVGLLSFYKNYDPKFAIVYIEEVDHIKDLVKLRYFTSMPDASEQFSWDNVPSTPLFSKTRTHTLYDQNFVYERTIWLRIGDVNRLNVIISKKPDTRLSLRGKQHRQGVNACDIRASFQKTGIDERNLPQEVIDIRQAAKTAEVVRKYSGCWILMDRNTQADDNAEHLYRYIVKSHPYTKVFFVLSETSQDWKRLSNDKFNLIAFGSLEHKLALLNAAHLISSHADQYIFGGLENKYYSDIKSFRYTFLQHGITKDDLSSWLNAKPIDCFVTATHPEYISIAENGPYKFTNKEVVLSGFARHDHLRALKNEADKIILIMPTWRNSLVGPTTGAGNERELNPDFAKTQYAESWRTILHSQELRILAEAHDYKIIFFPHANIQPYLHVFDVPSYISIQGHTAGESIQLQFSRANLVVTDYSSIAFEVAALDRAIVYFQFDAQEVFSGAHIYRPGYFNYHRDGFGPVCETASEVINSIEEILNNNGQPAENYLKRMHDTFAFKDEDNSKRIYEAIHRLEQSTISKQTCRPAIVEHARRLMKHAQWKEALLAWNQAEPEGTEYFAEASFSCALAYRKLGRSAEAAKSLQIADSVGYDYAKIQSEQLLNAIEEKDFVRINQLYTTINAEDLHNEIDDGLLAAIVKSQRLENNYTLALKLIERASDLSHPEILRERAEIASHLMLWPEALELWQIAVVENDDAAILRYAQSCREMKLYPEAASSIARIKNGDSLPGFYKEAAEIAFVNTQWKTAEKLWTHESEISSLTPDCWLKLAKSRRKSGDLTSANTAISKANTAKDKRTLLQEKALLLTALGEFHEAVGAWEEFISRKDLSPNRDAWLHLAGARYKTGQILQAKKELEKFESLCEATKKSLRLRELIEKSLTIKIAG
jgi:CDP-glycerol glycerophosphotransferase (TagB/SpsB family)